MRLAACLLRVTALAAKCGRDRSTPESRRPGRRPLIPSRARFHVTQLNVRNNLNYFAMCPILLTPERRSVRLCPCQTDAHFDLKRLAACTCGSTTSCRITSQRPDRRNFRSRSRSVLFGSGPQVAPRPPMIPAWGLSYLSVAVNCSAGAYMDKFTHQQNLDLFVHRQNLARFQKLLDETKDAAHRKQLSKLLAEEKSKDQPPPGG
jgi:hypothetical protein